MASVKVSALGNGILTVGERANAFYDFGIVSSSAATSLLGGIADCRRKEVLHGHFT